jgi:hypothetical protein
MNDPRCSRLTRVRRTGMLSLLLLALPLVLGARECEDATGDGSCDGGDCEPGGQGGASGSAGGDGGPAGRGGSGGIGGSGGTAGNGGGEGCLHEGEHHDPGDSFPSADGCNTCTCTEGGLVACTLRACTDVCGGMTGLPCPASHYCSYPEAAQCGAADQLGTCEERPDACTKQYDPVCGCDDTTYGNACEAAANGVSIARDGECDGGSAGGGGTGGDGGGDGGTGSGQTCGGIASLECAGEDEFCNYAPSAGGQGCDGTISDAAGVCQERPQACTEQFDPVCGCDRRTYGNACAANSAGMSVLHDGQCTEIDCAAIGGHAVDGLGPAPVCPKGEVDHGAIVYSNGMIAIEGTICCVPE